MKSKTINRRGIYHNRRRSPVAKHVKTLSQFAEYHRTLMQNTLRVSTLSRIYQPAFKSLISMCGDKRLDSYSIRDIEEFKSLRLKTCSPSTVSIEFRTLKAAFNSAEKWGFIVENPFSKSTRVRVPQQEPVFLTKKEFLMLLAVVRESDLRDLFLLAVQTGMRQGEIINLQWSQVDLKFKTIKIVNQNGFETKTGKARIIPLNRTVAGLLKRLKSRDSQTQLVFSYKGLPFTQSYVSHKFKSYIRQAGLNEAIRFHSLRHTFATWLVQKGTSLYEVQKLLGHTDIKTTQIYAHLLTEELHETVNKIAFR